MISKRAFLHSAAGAAIALLGAGLMNPAQAEPVYPSHPVRWIVPYAAGGATDVLSRLICQRLSERLGQPFVVENKPGAGSNIGTQAVIASPPDGYTLLLTSTANAINASFDPTLPFDFAKGIAPVAGVARIPLVLVINNDLPVHTNAALADLTIRQRLGDLGAIPIQGNAKEFAAMLTTETERWRKVVEMSGQKKE